MSWPYSSYSRLRLKPYSNVLLCSDYWFNGHWLPNGQFQHRCLQHNLTNMGHLCDAIHLRPRGCIWAERVFTILHWHYWTGKNFWIPDYQYQCCNRCCHYSPSKSGTTFQFHCLGSFCNDHLLTYRTIIFASVEPEAFATSAGAIG